MNSENPTHVEIMKIHKTKNTTFKGSMANVGKVIPQLFGHTTLSLRPTDYAMIAIDYEEYIERNLQFLMDNK